ncbi:MAG: DedA family protein [Bacteroidetes bacterium]|nr:DedA family protein [Bacteroidota bacterium]
MQMINELIYFVLHIDIIMEGWILKYENWTYLLLFVIVFCETGLVVTPFLPGDSLLFAAGTIAARDTHPLNIFIVVCLLMTAAFSGDNVNYFVGRFLGMQVYEKNYRLIKKEYLHKTHAFYEKHGGKALIIARFMPIIRTFAPFVAGVGTMTYMRFFSFSIVGNILWVNLFAFGGFFFGNITFVKNNFPIVILGIIVISLLPVIFTVIKNFAERRKTQVPE